MVVYYYSKVFKGRIFLYYMAKREIKVYECQCERCKHKWVTRSEGLPIVCPRCKSPYWDKPLNKNKKK